MATAITSLIEQARVALRESEPEQALALLLRAWSAVRAPELAELIERLSSPLASARTPPSGKTRTEFEHSWRARAEHADAVELGVLLPSLVDTDSHQARRRLKLIARHAPDPRIASVLCSTILHPPFTASSTAKFWQLAHELLCACADPRVLARLEEAPPLEPATSSTVQRLDAWRRRSVERLREQLDGLAIVLAPEDRERVQAITAGLEQARVVKPDLGPELLAAIVEAPGDLARRQVYADYLLSIGDPRGEFIALQLADARGELDRAGKARARALLGEHGQAWLGEVRGALVRNETQFVAGFLTGARIKQHHRGIERLIGNPVWATVETLEHAPVELICDPMMRSLRSIRWMDYQLFHAAKSARSLANVDHLAIESPWRETRELQAVLKHADWLPSLRSIALDIPTMPQDMVAWLWVGPLGVRLERVELSMQGQGGLGFAGYLRSLRNAAPLEVETLIVENYVMRARFTRRDGEWSRVELGGELPALGMERHLLEQLDVEIEIVSS
ncbi:MAG TPA: TIGR02996 domain-containing protein [Enhygromyxa sp.]|nr:TIGR02996 domain-containing protein [Enhygromyxa sp.]